MDTAALTVAIRTGAGAAPRTYAALASAAEATQAATSVVRLRFMTRPSLTHSSVDSRLLEEVAFFFRCRSVSPHSTTRPRRPARDIVGRDRVRARGLPCGRSAARTCDWLPAERARHRRADVASS